MNPTTNPIPFDFFMARVNEHLWSLAQVDDLDIPDFDYATAWESRTTPISTARAALKAAAYF